MQSNVLDYPVHVPGHVMTFEGEPISPEMLSQAKRICTMYGVDLMGIPFHPSPGLMAVLRALLDGQRS